jgi:hypothetical protein
MTVHVLYACGICGGLHRWHWIGDCREDDARFHNPNDFAERAGVSVLSVEVRSMEDRIEADNEEAA